MTQTQSKYVVGAEVVFVNTHWGRRVGSRSKIVKVYKNGNFILEGSDKQWKPSATMGWASPTGRRYGSEHVELWDEARHGAEIAARKREHEVAKIAVEFQNWLQERRSGNGVYHLTDEQVETLRHMMEKDKEDRRIAEALRGPQTV